MKIAFFVPHITREPGFEKNVSAHVQVPCEIARRLLAMEHRVELITDSLVDGYTLPACIPEGMVVKSMSSHTFAHNSTIPFSRILRMAISFVGMAIKLRAKLLRERYDVVHFFGTERMLLLIKLISPGSGLKFVMTLNQFIDNPFYGWIRRNSFFWKQLYSVVVSTEHMGAMVPANVPVMVIRHGIVKDFSKFIAGRDESKTRTRVLFWQTPAYLTGVDVCVELFRKLALLYPDVDFDFAVRLDSGFVDLVKYDHEVANGHVFHFPYPNGITIEQLLTECICVFQPFRKFTYYPQFVTLESLMLGIPVVLSDIPGSSEMVQDASNGFLFPIDDLDKAETAVRKLLDNRIGEENNHSRIQKECLEKWSWDGYERKLLEAYTQ